MASVNKPLTLSVTIAILLHIPINYLLVPLHGALGWEGWLLLYLGTLSTSIWACWLTSCYLATWAGTSLACLQSASNGGGTRWC